MGYLHSFMSAAIVASAGSGLGSGYCAGAGGGGRTFPPSGAGSCGSDDDCGSAIGGIASGDPDMGASGSALAMGGVTCGVPGTVSSGGALATGGGLGGAPGISPPTGGGSGGAPGF
jgi:hypothetical protein